MAVDTRCGCISGALSFRDAGELFAEPGIEVSYETIRCRTKKFGPQFARRLKRLRPSPSPRWHLDEMVCTVDGRRMDLWRAVDDEGENLDLVMQPKRHTEAALTLIERLPRDQSTSPTTIATGGLASWTSALAQLDFLDLHRPGVIVAAWPLDVRQMARATDALVRRLEHPRRQGGADPAVRAGVLRPRRHHARH